MNDVIGGSPFARSSQTHLCLCVCTCQQLYVDIQVFDFTTLSQFSSVEVQNGERPPNHINGGCLCGCFNIARAVLRESWYNHQAQD